MEYRSNKKTGDRISALCFGTSYIAEAKETEAAAALSKPCPVELNIGLINKYYDLAKNGDAMAAEHYGGLDFHAADCI